MATLEVGPRKYPGGTAAQAFGRLSRKVGPFVTAARENAKPAKISQCYLSEPRPTAQQERAAATTFQHQVQSLIVDDLFWRPHLSRPEFRERSKNYPEAERSKLSHRRSSPLMPGYCAKNEIFVDIDAAGPADVHQDATLRDCLIDPSIGSQIGSRERYSVLYFDIVIQHAAFADHRMRSNPTPCTNLCARTDPEWRMQARSGMQADVRSELTIGHDLCIDRYRPWVSVRQPEPLHLQPVGQESLRLWNSDLLPVLLR